MVASSCTGNRHDVVVDVVAGLLVEVVADAGAMGEQLLDGHRVVDEREVVAEHASGPWSSSRSVPSSIRLATASAVRPLLPLAMPNRVSTVLGITHPRWASP